MQHSTIKKDTMKRRRNSRVVKHSTHHRQILLRLCGSCFAGFFFCFCFCCEFFLKAHEQERDMSNTIAPLGKVSSSSGSGAHALKSTSTMMEGSNSIELRPITFQFPTEYEGTSAYIFDSPDNDTTIIIENSVVRAASTHTYYQSVV